MIQSILSNLAVILLSHLVITTLIGYRDRFSKRRLQLYVVIFMSITVISMFYLPIQFSEYRFDLRLIPLIMLAIFTGWHITIPVLVIACIWRYFLGGDGAIPGIVFGMSLPTIFALAYIRIVGNRKMIWDKVVLVSICWLLSDIPLMFYLHDGVEILKQISFLRLSSFLVATFIYYTVIEIENSRINMKRELEFLATHDQLTKLLNRQECIRRAEIKNNLSEKNAHHFMVMIDIDHFKKLNDQYGHAAGDYTLVQIADIFKSFEKSTLQAARYGGEEFLLWICAKDKESVIETVEKIQQKIRSTQFEITIHQAIPITVSIGMAYWPTGTSIHDAIKEADCKLYIAKDKGRNQIIV